VSSHLDGITLAAVHEETVERMNLNNEKTVAA